MTARTLGRLLAFLPLLVLGCSKPLPKPIASPLNYTVKDIDGKDVPLSQYKGKVVLIVNTAGGVLNRNGFAEQLEGFEKLRKKYKDRGFEVLAFPSNSFGSLEPGDNEEIKKNYQTRFHVTYPIFSKVNARTPDIHPLFKMLEDSDVHHTGELKWNFTKFLVGRDGLVIERYTPNCTPEASLLTQAIEAALGPEEKTTKADEKDKEKPKSADPKK